MSPYRLFPEGWNRRRVAFATAAVGGMLLVAGLIIGVIYAATVVSQLRATQLDGTPQGRKLLRASDQIISCTTPDGECTRENQQNQKKLIAGLIQSNRQVSATAAACAALPEVSRLPNVDDRAAAILACMGKLQDAAAAQDEAEH